MEYYSVICKDRAFTSQKARDGNQMENRHNLTVQLLEQKKWLAPWI